jgi:pimeloyl-ACP methyl ester carboxylesterase
MCGDADAVVDPRNSKLLAGRIPRSQVVVFPGLGHLFFWEKPAQFAKAVTSFLLAPGIAADQILPVRRMLLGD